MTRKSFFITVGCLAAFVFVTACKKDVSPSDGAPPTPQVVPSGDMSLVSVDKPGQFPLAAAETHEASAELNVTGAVFPDISREVPVITLANGRGQSQNPARRQREKGTVPLQR